MSAEAQSPPSCSLVHHGVAATSSGKASTWWHDGEADILVYASHATINLARPVPVQLAGADTSVPVWNVHQTLRTQHSYSTGPTEKAPIITAVTTVRRLGRSTGGCLSSLACGFSNGSLVLWNCRPDDHQWQERVLIDAIHEPSAGERGRLGSITDLTGVRWNANQAILASCSSAGVTVTHQESDTSTVTRHSLTPQTASAVRFEALSDTTLLLLVGTAAPRHNRILVYSVNPAANNGAPTVHACGALTGHEDWVTCFAWQSPAGQPPPTADAMLLASGSQDCKIRLWKFTTIALETAAMVKDANDVVGDIENDDILPEEEEDLEEHESRMEIVWQWSAPGQPQQSRLTSVSLEALLLGHEGPVTAAQWYPPRSDASAPILLSSSMDRSILLWSPSEDDGIWTPISRVGSAGGILGGSIGSTLLGYLNVLIAPSSSQWLIGHAYGGALHVWNRANATDSPPQWKATPCVTGHFDGITDLCWESTFGDYLLTVSADQTCRLWAPVTAAAAAAGETSSRRDVWVELARPQVHGYNLSAVTSLSSPERRHWMVSGADEKELRILDAPLGTVRVLQAAAQQSKDADKENVAIQRVERAYIPSLGLSNKATAAEGAEEDVLDDNNNNNTDKTRNRKTAVELPSERDLGALSLWLETRKMFGHNTELFCVTSTLEAKTDLPSTVDADPMESIVVASTAKARDVDAAGIRIWNPHNGECLQTLSGGHKATVATLSFSPDGGKYLASSGKDRRLCLWKKNPVDGQILYSLAAAKDSAHKRIIWSVHFCPYDSTILASGSRDGNIKIWKLSEGEDGTTLTMDPIFSFAPQTLNPTKKPDSVTALAFAPLPLPPDGGRALLALGLECGTIELWSIPLHSTGPPANLAVFADGLCHVATVAKLAWRPLRQEDKEVLTLASGSTDHGCRIFEVNVAHLSR